MPIACPDCGRPNNERLEACLYCGAWLPRPDEAEWPASASDPPLLEAGGLPASDGGSVPRSFSVPASRHRSMLVLEPIHDASTSDLSPERVSAVGAALSVDLYIARKHLTSRHVAVVARSEDPARLEDLGRALALLGLTLTLISPDELAALGDAWIASGVDLAAPADSSVPSGAICFWGGDGPGQDRRLVQPGAATLIVHGTLQVLAPDGSATDRRFGAGLGSVSPSREALEELRSDYPMLEVHTSDGSRIRVCLANFDFSGLGERKRPSSLLNLKRVVHELVEASPGVIQDDHFRFLPVEPDPGAGLLGLASTNEAQFDRYARTLAVHRRKLAIGDAISQRRTNR